MRRNLSGKPSKGIKRRAYDKKPEWKKHEDEVADALSIKPTAGSGASPFSKGDAVGDAVRVECKSTEKKSIALKLSWLEKISKEAYDSGRTPLLAIKFTKAESAASDWIALPLEDYLELLGDRHQ